MQFTPNGVSLMECAVPDGSAVGGNQRTGGVVQANRGKGVTGGIINVSLPYGLAAKRSHVRRGMASECCGS